MLKGFQEKLKEQLKQSLTTTKFNFNLDVDYSISKFYELGYKVSFNPYDKTYRSCCPICKEGKSWGKKQRCYFITENDNIYCHNCGSSLKPYNWIREVSGMSDKELRIDYEAFSPDVEDVTPETDRQVVRVIPSLPEDSINLFDKLQVEFYKHNPTVATALKVIKNRRIDTGINAPDAIYVSLTDIVHKNRLIIPFKDGNGKIVFYQSRKMFEFDEKPKYTCKQGADKSIYGIDHVDSKLDTVFIFEGPIDSFFVQNGLGLAGINKGHHKFTQVQQDQLEELKLFKKIWVLDNQWIDKTSREKTENLLDMGECVFIWPKHYMEYKDFNEICVTKSLDQISPTFIKKNSKCGRSAILKFKILFGNL